MYNKKIVGALLVDISAGFVIDHNLLKKHMCYGFLTLAILWIQSYLSNRRGFSLMEASLMLQFDLIFE
jgi:hypothetical protein